MLNDEIGRALSQWMARGGGVTMLVLATGAVALAVPVARRLGSNRFLVAAALLSIALIVGATLASRGLDGEGAGFGSPLFACLDTGDCWERIFEVDLLSLLNFVLFVPAGLFVGLVTRRPLITGAALVGMAGLIEVGQGLFHLGAPDPGDLIANSLGAIVGVALAAAVQRTQRGAWSPRVVAGSILGAGFLAGSAWVGITVGADARRDSLAAEIGSAFAGMTSAEIATALATPTGAERIFSTTETRPDYLGRVGNSDVYAARYSTQFLGFDRCVFVRWERDRMTISPGSGAECSVFRERP